jgi:hypothetical protein
VAELIYLLCIFTSLACASLLLVGHRRTGHRLLLWSGLCFIGLTFNNLFLLLDKVVFPHIDFLPARLFSALVAQLLLLYGLIYEKE